MGEFKKEGNKLLKVMPEIGKWLEEWFEEDHKKMLEENKPKPFEVKIVFTKTYVKGPR